MSDTSCSKADTSSPASQKLTYALAAKGIRWMVDGALVLMIAYLSVPVVQNLLQIDGSRQVMNASFGSFRLVNTYGAFGNVGQARYEPIVSITHDGITWQELEFPCKPGKLDRRPCFCAPYHYRLDWNIWFLGFKPHLSYLQRRETWMWPFLLRVLEGDQVALTLLAPESAHLYYPIGQNGERHLPKLVKVDMWRYRMRASLWAILKEYGTNGTAIWWTREYEESLIPPIDKDSPLFRKMVQMTRRR
eukprot:gnl/MRDRNA2_/MRDRNA2_448584_c0_seq1.p1 gnl/MRDRNA2_/MRDRNA2_448584_c0~~gnl/MRDRNA2_/MRDRNA2_448584_c0_seq1.p1  ORF type:complete len:266 (+),score=25.82 gnl/MRDRNA2_/MRDRNA2_448584_c0_seq1:58-798(+)